MTVATGVGGVTVTGVVVGSGVVAQGETPPTLTRGAVDIISTLPFTGANQIVVLFVLGLLAVLAGTLMLGLARRHSPVLAVSPPT